MLSKAYLLLLPALATTVVAQTTTESDSEGGLNASCQSALEAFVTEIPRPPSNLATNTEIMAGADTTGDPCDLTIPTSLQSDVADYASTVLSFFSASEKDIASLFDNCPGAEGYGIVTSCASKWLGKDGGDTKTTKSSDDEKTTATDDSESSATETGSASDSGVTDSAKATTTGADSTASEEASGTSTSEGGAAKETGLRLAAVAVAGLVAAAL